MNTYGAILASMDPTTLLEHVGDQTGQYGYTETADKIGRDLCIMDWDQNPATLDGDVIRDGRTGCAEFQVVR